MEKHVLSKSTFIKGLQCEKALFFQKYRKDLKDELSESQQAIFAQGTSVGELAQELFPGGADCTPDSYFEFQAAVIRTKEEIEKGTKIIYEAAFQFNGVLAALDILVQHSDGWRAYEVKSSTSVSETYELDAAIQYYCITNSGIELKDISIVHINNQYVKNGPINVNELFTIESVLEKVQNHLAKIPNQITHLKSVLQLKEEPAKDIGPHCNTPYQCDFAGHCWKHIPENSVFDIALLRSTKKFDLYSKNAINFQDIPEDYPLNENQWMQVKSELNNESYIDAEYIRKFVSELNYPLFHLDFETFATAVPIFDGSSPFQQLVFQYSLHIEQKDGTLEHREFLADANGYDPRIPFIEQLINDCMGSGDVIVYNEGFEKGKLFDLIKAFPQYKLPLLQIIDRLKDLMVPFRDRKYYTPEMQGSYSIKKVLPALVPEYSYKELNIQEGNTASNTFAKMVLGTFEGDLEQTRKDLLEYCKLDTLAMVKILDVLKKV